MCVCVCVCVCVCAHCAAGGDTNTSSVGRTHSATASQLKPQTLHKAMGCRSISICERISPGSHRMYHTLVPPRKAMGQTSTQSPVICGVVKHDAPSDDIVS